MQEKLNTSLANDAYAHVLAFKNIVSEKTYTHMIEGIKNFDVMLRGCGFDAIQAKEKLNRIKQLTAEEIMSFDKLIA
jgi:ferredoxin-fold anticodon binding domain-containing protein